MSAARITLAELVSATGTNNGDLTPTAAAATLVDPRADFTSGYQAIEVIAALVAEAETLAEKRALHGRNSAQFTVALPVNAAGVAAAQSHGKIRTVIG